MYHIHNKMYYKHNITNLDDSRAYSSSYQLFHHNPYLKTEGKLLGVQKMTFIKISISKGKARQWNISCGHHSLLVSLEKKTWLYSLLFTG